MPRAELPTSTTGWLVAIGAGVVGFLAGFVFIAVCERML
jgi:uncharacterized protein involved in exopolysaccharide biosynthesis